MQQWTRQSQCLLCQIRDATQRYFSTVQQQRRQISELRRKRPTTKRVLRGTISDKDLERHPSFKNDFKDTIPSTKRRQDLRDENLSRERDTEPRRNEILRALRVARIYYKTNKMSKTSSLSQLEGLDPENVLWPKFENLIQQVADGHRSLGSRWKSLGKLFSGSKADLRSNAEKAVQFAFLDYVLDNTDANKPGVLNELDTRYPTEWYPRTRGVQRAVHLHVGPTNSGKTYNALKRLEQSQDGFYAGPLRLLAHEVYSRFNNRSIKCDLVTGDDVRRDESGSVNLYSSTVEMVDINRTSEVGVIDEIQLLADRERGWAWTRVLLAARVKELHLCGETRVVPLIRAIVASMGDTLHIHQYERLNPLKVMSKSLKGNLQNLRKGDCVVSFSVVNIHALRRHIETETSRRCAVIYGSLPPETRAQQAALFNDPDNNFDFLVASDAIGMGLNLSIKRVVFETTKKFDGTSYVPLSIPQIKQIAGRAGRYRTARDDDKKSESKSSAQGRGTSQSVGLVTCLDEADLPVLQKALPTEGPPLKTAGILPPGEFYEDLALRLPENTPFEYLMHRMNTAAATHERFSLCDMEDKLKVARLIEHIPNMSIADRLTICAAPAGGRGVLAFTIDQVLIALSQAISKDKAVTIADVEEIPLEILDDPMSSDKTYLVGLEGLHKCLILYLWLSYRFPRVLRDQDMAFRAKELCEEKINTTLMKFSANPKLSQRLAEIRKSSEMLAEQARDRGAVDDDLLINNPDPSVEEVDAANIQDQIQDREAGNLEEKVEVEGELDVGQEEDDIGNLSREKIGRSDHLSSADIAVEVDERKRAYGFG